MFVSVRLESWSTNAFKINTRHIVTAKEVILRDNKKDVPGLQISMSDGMIYNIVEGLTITDLAPVDLSSL